MARRLAGQVDGHAGLLGAVVPVLALLAGDGLVFAADVAEAALFEPVALGAGKGAGAGGPGVRAVHPGIEEEHEAVALEVAAVALADAGEAGGVFGGEVAEALVGEPEERTGDGVAVRDDALEGFVGESQKLRGASAEDGECADAVVGHGSFGSGFIVVGGRVTWGNGVDIGIVV